VNNLRFFDRFVDLFVYFLYYNFFLSKHFLNINVFSFNKCLFLILAHKIKAFFFFHLQQFFALIVFILCLLLRFLNILAFRFFFLLIRIICCLLSLKKFLLIF